MDEFDVYGQEILKGIDALEDGTRHLIQSASVGALNIAFGKMLEAFEMYVDSHADEMRRAARWSPTGARRIYRLREVFETRAELKIKKLYAEWEARAKGHVVIP